MGLLCSLLVLDDEIVASDICHIVCPLFTQMGLFVDLPIALRALQGLDIKIFASQNVTLHTLVDRRIVRAILTLEGYILRVLRNSIIQIVLVILDADILSCQQVLFAALHVDRRPGVTLLRGLVIDLGGSASNALIGVVVEDGEWFIAVDAGCLVVEGVG